MDLSRFHAVLGTTAVASVLASVENILANHPRDDAVREALIDLLFMVIASKMAEHPTPGNFRLYVDALVERLRSKCIEEHTMQGKGSGGL